MIKLADPGFKAEVQEVWPFEPAETVQCDVIIGSAGPPESGEVSLWAAACRLFRRQGLNAYTVKCKKP